MCAINKDGWLYKLDLDTREISQPLKNDTDQCVRAHSLSILSDGSLMLSDAGSRQVKDILEDGRCKVIAGNGKQSKTFGLALSSTFCQPTAICSEGKSMFLVDTGNATICLLTGTCGMPKYLENLGKLYDAFGIHEKGELISLNDSLNTVVRVVTYLNGIVAKIRELPNAP